MSRFLIKVWMFLGARPTVLYTLFATVLSGVLAGVVWTFGAERRKVCMRNLQLCFPSLPDGQIRSMAKRHMYLYLRTFLDRSWLWRAPEAEVRERIRISGLEVLQKAVSEGPVIVLAPHFLGLDAGWTRLTLELKMVTMYSHQKNPAIDDALRQGRARFGQPVLLSRQEGVRGIVRAMKAGLPLYYLPDMDFGPKDAVFVPFFGNEAATVTAVARLARLVNAQVVPCPTYRTARGYEIRVQSPLKDFPGEDDVAATARINQVIEALVMERPAEYLWVHKRFKTRPPGAPSLYRF